MPVRPANGFSYRQFLWANLWTRPVRSALTIVAIALQVFLVLFIVGLSSGVVREWGKRVEGVGADLFVQPPNASIFFAFSKAIMEETLADRLLELPDVAQVAPVLVVNDTAGLSVIYGIDYPSFHRLGRGFEFLAGGPFQAADEVLVDDIRARASGLRVGDRIELLGHTFRVAGIVRHGKGARYFLPLRTAQEIVGAQDHISLIYVRSHGDTEATRTALLTLLPGYTVRSVAEYMTLMNSENLPELQPFVHSIVGIGVAISFLVVLLTMHTLVLERTREIGILKALGASKRGISGLILGETLLLVVLGCGLGLVATYAVRAVLAQTNPTLTVLIDGAWILRAILLAALGATAGALYPAWRAAGFDPVDALAYE
ncbi:MAG: ABC transporter permease [Firmicutes bacterium]|nr:ABC transporter permease [Bacillota bacterium]